MAFAERLALGLFEDGSTRRDFLKYCGSIAAMLGLGDLAIPQIAEAIETAAARPPLIWLHFGSCTGCTESFIQGIYPTADEVILNVLSVDYQETIMAAAGKQAEEARYATMEEYRGQYLVAVEGASLTGAGGDFLRIGGKTGVEVAREVCADAAAVMNIGSCSFDGGWVACDPNPTGATGTQQATGLSPKKFVNLPTCPVHPKWIVATVVNYLLLGSLPELDSKGRPKFLYGMRIHDICERRARFDAGQFVERFGSEEAAKQYCLYKMGCKGPDTYSNCSLDRWNAKANWCIGAGAPCIGCAQERWADRAGPFFVRPAHVEIPGIGGVERSVDAIGFTLLGAAAGGVAAHAILTARRKVAAKVEVEKEARPPEQPRVELEEKSEGGD
jgi:NiFe hydrogenase small subunit HydA